MITHIFQAEGPLRHQLYVSFLLFLFGYPVLGAFYFGTFFLFFWDEFKVDFLDYDEFMEECIDLFEMDIDSHLRAIYNWDNLVTTYWSKPGRTRPDHMRSGPNAYDPSADYEDGRWINLFDHPEAYPLFMAAEWLHEEWEWVSETDIEPTCEQSMEDLQLYYFHFNKSRKTDLEEETKNKHLVYTRDLISVPIFSKATNNLLSSTSNWSMESLPNSRLRLWLLPGINDFHRTTRGSLYSTKRDYLVSKPKTKS